MGSRKTQHGKQTVTLKLSQIEPGPESESESSLPLTPLAATSLASLSESIGGTHSTEANSSPSPSLSNDIASDTESASSKPTKKRKQTHRKQKNTMEDLEEEQEAMPKKPKSVFFFAHAKEMLSFVILSEVIILIPEVASDCIQCVSLNSDILFEAVLQVPPLYQSPAQATVILQAFFGSC